MQLFHLQDDAFQVFGSLLRCHFLQYVELVASRFLFLYASSFAKLLVTCMSSLSKSSCPSLNVSSLRCHWGKAPIGCALLSISTLRESSGLGGMVWVFFHPFKIFFILFFQVGALESSNNNHGWTHLQHRSYRPVIPHLQHTFADGSALHT